MDSMEIAKRINDIDADYHTNGVGSNQQRTVDFNKAVCVEMGLTLYMMDAKSRDLAKRVEVTQ